ncbi:PHB depolymerase family esterase [Variovorax sp. dw_308]|uniref:extracellular catalytic domain type 1 short-chain-length polyhydroxyalkanoate depolymerase n=1 Tax=Variovorax sp. dw_308 TaxID=2721546 RepID=UPI001C45E742|nr:PHB depolymerase family esterase [Variovorax sp. dw_308]
MARRYKAPSWGAIFQRSIASMTRQGMRVGQSAMASVVKQTVKQTIKKRKPPAGAGQWLQGVAMGATGMRRYRLFRPPGVKVGERLPLMVMLHGCSQDARTFANSTRMNVIAARERFMVLYPEQDRVSNPQGCWNWYDTTGGRAYGEAALIMSAIDQVTLLYGGDRARVAAVGLSAGASMAALLVSRHPDRFKAVVMHSGIPPGTAHSTMSAVGAMHGLRHTKSLAARPLAVVTSWPPLMVIHGGLDRVVSPNNGHAAVQAWASAAGARATATRSVQRGSRYPATVTDYKRKGSTIATLVEIARLGHAWSGGAAKEFFSDDKGPDASRMAWTFASKQFRQ